MGTIGDDLKMVYTAHGNTVGLGQRMEQLATPDQVYLTENSAKLVSGFFRLRDLGPFELKGVSAPVRAYELEGVGALHTQLEVSRSRGFSRFVGRTEETATLEAALDRAIGEPAWHSLLSQECREGLGGRTVCSKAKTKNGMGVAQGPNGKTCVKGKNNADCN